MTLFEDPEDARLRARYLTTMAVPVTEWDVANLPVTWSCGCTRRRPDGHVYSNSFSACKRHEAVLGSGGTEQQPKVEV
jgi:hypothetical protein